VADEAFEARIYGGIHFRKACRDVRAMGTRLGSFVMTNVAQSARGKRKRQISHNHPQGEVGAGGENANNTKGVTNAKAKTQKEEKDMKRIKRLRMKNRVTCLLVIFAVLALET
jgi:hypothetical protein